jgi:histidinol-phosphate aminotransferase
VLSARGVIRSLEKYSPPLAGRAGLRLDFNENSHGCSPRVLARLASLTPDDLSRYPEREPVEEQVASFLRLTPNQLLLTNGIDEAIHLLCETYLEPGDEAVLVEPGYSMYRIYAAATGARIIAVSAADFRFPFEAMLASLTQQTRLIAIANPNNPTGALASPKELMNIAEAAPYAAILIDEAYCEFSGQTILHEISKRSNLFVARTFSKAYGMAGLRIGILAGPSEQMQMVRKVSSPYNVNQAALKCLPEALNDQDYLVWYVEQVKQSRTMLEDELRALHIHYWPSHANFILARFGTLKHAFVRSMKRQGILLRDRSSDPGCDGCVRITLGTTEQTTRLLRALRVAFSEVELSPEIPA